METYVSNSRKSKEETSAPKKRVEKIVTGTVKNKKKNEFRKLTDIFISEDATNVKSYILMDVLVPAIKDAIEDIVTNGIRMILRGETSARKRNSTVSKISYNGYYNRDNDRRRESDSPRSRSGFDYDELVFATRGDAELVLEAMNDIIDQYGTVSVGDLYDLAGKSTDNYTANRYGWSDIRTADPVRVSDGYILKLPRALPLN